MKIILKVFLKKFLLQGNSVNLTPKMVYGFSRFYGFFKILHSQSQNQKSQSKVKKKSHSVQLNHSGSDNHWINILGNERGKKPLENFTNGFYKKNCHYSKYVILDP